MSSRATIVFPASTASWSLRPSPATWRRGVALERAIAADTEKLFHAKHKQAATARTEQASRVSTSRIALPPVSAATVAWARVAPTAMDPALKATLTGSRRATACTTATASGAMIDNQGQDTRNRPTMIAASDQVNV